MPRDVLDRDAPEGDVTVAYGEFQEQVIEGWRGGDTALVVFLHGGFWRAAWDRTHARPLCNELASRGYTVALPEYRRTGGGGGWPCTFTDVSAAVSAAPEQLGVEGMPLILAGHSAGGQLALWAASERDAVRGVLALAPVADLRAAYEDDLDKGAVTALLGGSPAEHPDRYDDACPLGLPLMCPAVLMHGDADDRVPLSQSEAYAAKTGAPLVRLSGADHFDLIDPDSSAWPAVLVGLASLHAW